MAPEFAEFLAQTPEEQRMGPVFEPRGYRGDRPRQDWISKVGAKIGEAAEIVVETDPTTGKRKYASPHDLRRSFGVRWSLRVLPQQLRELMRHESIETTLKYYVGQDAERTAEELWRAYEAERKETKS